MPRRHHPTPPFVVRPAASPASAGGWGGEEACYLDNALCLVAAAVVVEVVVVKVASEADGMVPAAADAAELLRGFRRSLCPHVVPLPGPRLNHTANHERLIGTGRGPLHHHAATLLEGGQLQPRSCHVSTF